jgi:hypothetical protein
MQATRKRLSAEEQLVLLQANALDYMVLAAAGIIPLFMSGMSIQKPTIGIIFSVIYSLGLLFSYAMRRLIRPNKVFQYCAWLLFAVALLVGFYLRDLNAMLPEGGFDFRLLVPAYLCFFLCLASFFLWSDSPMMFMTVPGIALFGILSWLDTSGYFEISLILFMTSVAVLLTRLHLRAMYANARAAGFTDLHDLRLGPWRAVAGPFLAILTILAVAGFSWFVAPYLGTAARAAIGNPSFTIQPPVPPTAQGSGIRAERTIGNGPVTSSNRLILQVRGSSLPPYLRYHAYDSYRRTGWNQQPVVRQIAPSDSAPTSNIDRARVFEFDMPRGIERGQVVEMFVRSASGGHTYAPVPGPVIRFEYDGSVSQDRRQFILLSDGFPNGKTFFVRAQWQRPTAEMMRSARPASQRSPSSDRDSDVIDPQVRELARQLAQGKRTDYDVIQACMDYIADQCMYNLNADAITGDRDRVAAFLFETRQGYCDLFASALAVLLRANGINARVAVGYRIEGSPDSSGWIPVRDRHAHMWTEVHFEEYGWIPFDVTDMARAVPGGEVGALLDEEEGNLTLSWAVKASIIVFSSVAVILIAAFTIGAIRDRAAVRGVYRKLRPSYLTFLRVIGKQVKRPRMPSETTRQYAMAYRDVTGNGEQVFAVAEKFERAFYGIDEPSQEQISDIREAVKNLVASTKNGNVITN